MAMGEQGMAEHQDHTDSGHMQGPENTLAMAMGQGPFGNIGMGGMFTLVKVRDDLEPGDFRDPGWYRHPEGEVAYRVSDDPNFGNPARRGKLAGKGADALPTPSRDASGHGDHGGPDH
jgi:hypothetical protein